MLIRSRCVQNFLLKHFSSNKTFSPHEDRCEIFDGKTFLHENLVELFKIFVQDLLGHRKKHKTLSYLPVMTAVDS